MAPLVFKRSMNQQEEKQPYKPKGVLPIRAPWRYKPDGSYFKGTKNTAYFADYYHSNSKGQRAVCEICKANISASYRGHHQERKTTKKKVCLIARQRQNQELEQERKEREQVYREFD